MIKNNRGVTLSILVVTIIVITIIAGVTITTSDLLIKDAKEKAVVSNMYLVKGKAESIYEEYEFSGDNLPSTGDKIGTKVEVSTLSIYGILSDQLPSDTTIDKYWYKWTKNTLEENGLDPEMLSGSAEYIVNYSTGEVIYTAGVTDTSGSTKYTLTDMVKTK